MPGNYDDIIRGVLDSTSPTTRDPVRAPLQIAQPAPVDDAAAYADAKNKLLGFLAAQQQKSAEEGYWDPVTNRPTKKGLTQAGFKYAGALTKGELAGEGIAGIPEILNK